MTSWKSQAIYFEAPWQISLRWENLPPLGDSEVCIETICSAVSSGTELLVYRGQFPDSLAVDETIPSLAGAFSYPLKYGYAAVGRVVQIGKAVDKTWQDRLVFAFHPHESIFYARPQELFPVPADISPEEAVFLPNMETAVNLVMDAAPLIGERVAVFGQGVVGLLTTALLAYFPLAALLTFDLYEKRRQLSLQLGAHVSLKDPADMEETDRERWLPQGADVCIEASGSPAALDQALALTGYGGRVIIASWYGKKPVQLDLGGRFHRSRIRLISSQVSSIDPQWSGRWDKARRFELVWEMLKRVRPSRLISHRLPFEQAEDAYRLIDQTGEHTLQVVFTYT